MEIGGPFMQGKLNLIEKEGAVKFISEKGIKILNLCHIPEDGRLKTLSFAATDGKRVHQILELGERVDGSSLFSYIAPSMSDIYITPKLDTAFLNPFCTAPTLNILCSYLDENGNPLDVAPENILLKAEKKLLSSTSVVLKALAELEFYVIKQETEPLFPGFPERSYHESMPFARFEHLRNEILVTLADIGVATKYGHAEAGKVLGKDGTVMEQHEIEFLPQDLVRTAETVAIAKWVIRNICAEHGVSVSFSPKVALEHAGNGMHIHLCGLKNGKNIIRGPDGKLSVEAKMMIGGILKFGASLTAFANPLPVSYLRIGSRQEAPLHICWGKRNRLALIRIPLWWNFKTEKRGEAKAFDSCRFTFEFRAPDPSANTYLLLAGIATAVEYGLKNPEETLRIAKESHVKKTAEEGKKLQLLPNSCSESAVNLERDRIRYETDGIFPKAVIDVTVRKLKSYKDEALPQKFRSTPQKAEELIQKYLHCG
jgi:glutamine synthetase